MKPKYTILAASLLSMVTANAAITYVHTYKLGESGSVSGGNPQDSTGSAHFTNAISGGPITSSVGVTAPGSTNYATFSGNRSNYGADYSGFATDNFAVEVWVYTSNATQNSNDFLSTNNTTGALKFQVANGNWATSYDGLAWIGAANGTGQTITLNTWTHLAVVRDNGTSTFYIDGVAQAGTPSSTPVHGNNGHLGVQKNGTAYFDGAMDELNMFTFTSGDDPVAALSINAVPEPSSTALLGLGGLALILRRRK